MAPRCVAIYARLSPRSDGSYEGVEEQERWGRDYAAKRWPGEPIEVFADRGISAAADDWRPDYERLRQWIRDGRVAHVWVVEQARIERRVAGRSNWFELADEMDAVGLDELHTDRDGVVGVQDEVAGIKAVLAASEVRKMRRRVLDTLAERARNGEPSGARPFGYVRAETPEKVKTYAVVPEQAAVIRKSAERILAGWSLGAVAADLAADGVKAPHGGKMIGEAVRRFLVAPSVAGKRSHGEKIYRGNWEPILDEETWEEVRARLDAPRTVTRSDGGTFTISQRHAHRPPAARRYVLTGGLAKCAECGADLYGSIKQPRLRKGEDRDNRRPGVPYLLCHSTRGGRGCVGVQLEPVESYVADRLFDELDKPEFLAALATDEHADERDRLTRALSAVDRKRATLADRWTRDDFSDEEWDALRAGLDRREKDLRAELAAVPAPPVRLDGIAGARQAWPAMTLDEKRELLRTFISEVKIHRAKPGTRTFDSDRVKITWRLL
jgi:DNA invertase Pin-like site-specific DNA recombinase